jgi:HSP20 family molecular chaperone IbpA
MKNNTVYPGSFQPPSQIRNHRLRNNLKSEAFPPWEIDRLLGMLLVRCWLPGVRREEIDLTISKRRVYISVLSTLPDNNPHSYLPIRYVHQFPLPEDADPMLVAAEYHRGMLCLRIPLAAKVEQSDPMDLHVIVY